MNKIISLIISFVFILINASNAHIQHYANLNEIKFEIYRNDKKVGYHNIIFSRDFRTLPHFSSPLCMCFARRKS